VTAAAGTGMADVLLAVICDLEAFGRKRRP
jgi:hypothetical protein